MDRNVGGVRGTGTGLHRGRRGRKSTKSARTVAEGNISSVGEFPDVICAGLFGLETGGNAFAKIFDLRKFDVDLGRNTSDIEPMDI